MQQILDGRKANGTHKPKPAFVYSGLVQCGHCGCSLVAEVKKGKYIYYHCSGYRGKCGEPYTREEVLDQRFSFALRDIVVPATVFGWLNENLVKSDQAGRAARASATTARGRVGAIAKPAEHAIRGRLDGRMDLWNV